MDDLVVDIYTDSTDTNINVEGGGSRETSVEAESSGGEAARAFPQSQTGAYSTFEIVEVVTGAPGSLAKAENLGTKTAVKLRLTIPQGREGVPGKPGPPGKSAYEAAKEAGYGGTEEEFNRELAAFNEAVKKAEEAQRSAAASAGAAKAAQAAAEKARDEAIGSSGGGIKFTTDETLTLTEDNVLKVNTAKDAEADNTLPITSAAVFMEIGNIDALLQSI